MMATLQMSDSSEDLDVNEKSAFLFCITRLILFLQIFRICYLGFVQFSGFKLDSESRSLFDSRVRCVECHAAAGAITDSLGQHSRTAGTTDAYRSPTG
jgi:cell division protein FtsI/penicillin-binding protein 2